METLFKCSKCSMDYLNHQDLCSDSSQLKNWLAGSGMLYGRAHCLINMEICVLRSIPRGWQPLKKHHNWLDQCFPTLCVLRTTLYWCGIRQIQKFHKPYNYKIWPNFFVVVLNLKSFCPMQIWLFLRNAWDGSTVGFLPGPVL